MFLANLDGVDGVIVLVVVLVLVFGGSAIPKLARNLGSAKSEFEKGIRTAKDAQSNASSAETPPSEGGTTPPAN